MIKRGGGTREATFLRKTHESARESSGGFGNTSASGQSLEKV